MIGITGATGKIGRFVLEHFPDAVVIGRHKVEGHPFIRADLSRPLDKHLFKDIEMIIHLAGSTNFKKGDIYANNFIPTKHVAEAFDGPIIYASSVSVYGKRVGMASESTPVKPDSPYSKAKWDGEQLLGDRMILRLGTVYGPFGHYKNMVDAMRKGIVVLPSSTHVRVPFISVWEVANAFKIAAKNYKKGVFLVVPDRSPSIDEIITFAEAFWNKPIIRLVIGPTLFKWLFDGESAELLSHDRIFVRKRDFGWQPEPIEKGLLKLLSS